MELVKFSSALMLPISAILLAFFYTTAEAGAVTGWTNPVISTATGSGAATPSIAEDKAAGASTGVTIGATLASGTAQYAIHSQPTSDKVSIDGTSGVLSLKSGKTFDYETETTYVLVITASDGAGGTAGTATVTLSITNVDEAPVFASELYSAVLSDGATAGTAVVTVSATDVDASTTLTYTITGGNTNTDFAIASTGAITVATGKTLKKSTTSGYSLTVTVSDGSLSDTTSVLVVVQTCSSATTALASMMTMLLAVIAQKL